MRLQITFNRTTRQRMLPMDYQYFISAWTYKVLRQADREFAEFLHEQGYGQSGTKLYKLFCFSHLDFGKPALWKEKKLFEITATDIRLQLSFDVPLAASNFIKGLFINQEFFLGDRFNGIDIRVNGVEVLHEPEFQQTMRYRLQTPWVVSHQSNPDENPQYLSPNDEAFAALAIKHLVEKYNNTRTKKLLPNQLKLRQLGDFKRAGFVIKPGTPEQTRIVGNLFDFELTAPPELHRMIWSAGVSEKSSSGFGWVELQTVFIADRVSNSVSDKNKKQYPHES